MLIQGATRHEIETAAAETGVRLAYVRMAANNPVVAYRTVLRTANPQHPHRPRIKPKYRRLSYRERERKDGSTYRPAVPGAVCWHGHRDFLRALYRLAPSAIVKTTLTTYRSQSHFEATHDATSDQGGSYFGFGLDRSQLCSCPEGT